MSLNTQGRRLTGSGAAVGRVAILLTLLWNLLVVAVLVASLAHRASNAVPVRVQPPFSRGVGGQKDGQRPWATPRAACATRSCSLKITNRYIFKHETRYFGDDFHVSLIQAQHNSHNSMNIRARVHRISCLARRKHIGVKQSACFIF